MNGGEPNRGKGFKFLKKISLQTEGAELTSGFKVSATHIITNFNSKGMVSKSVSRPIVTSKIGTFYFRCPYAVGHFCESGFYNSTGWDSHTFR